MQTLLASFSHDGSFTTALVVAAVCVLGLLLERLALRRRWMPYFRSGFPPPEQLLPIPNAPEGEGTTSGVAYEVRGDVVLWWSRPDTRLLPSGLHGALRLVRTTRGVELVARWAPPWVPLLVGAWFAGLGLSQGQGYITVPVAALLIGGIVMLYRTATMTALAELRWEFVQGGAPP
jgi:hypothetical protein